MTRQLRMGAAMGQRRSGPPAGRPGSRPGAMNGCPSDRGFVAGVLCPGGTAIGSPWFQPGAGRRRSDRLEEEVLERPALLLSVGVVLGRHETAHRHLVIVGEIWGGLAATDEPGVAQHLGRRWPPAPHLLVVDVDRLLEDVAGAQVGRAGEELQLSRTAFVEAGIDSYAHCRHGRAADVIHAYDSLQESWSRVHDRNYPLSSTRSHGLSGQRAGGSFRQGSHDPTASHGGGPAGYCPPPDRHNASAGYPVCKSFSCTQRLSSVSAVTPRRRAASSILREDRKSTRL